jgi:hypothetical protein
MATLRPIRSVTEDELLRVVKRALRGKLDVDAIQDFVASVDWSGVIFERPAIADVLGAIENLTAQFDEGDLSDDEYRSAIHELFPELARSPAKP